MYLSGLWKLTLCLFLPSPRLKAAPQSRSSWLWRSLTPRRMLGSARCHARDHNRAKRSASHRLAQLLLLLSPPASSGLMINSRRGCKGRIKTSSCTYSSWDYNSYRWLESFESVHQNDSFTDYFSGPSAGYNVTPVGGDKWACFVTESFTQPIL